jgi:hypothetical protein
VQKQRQLVIITQETMKAALAKLKAQAEVDDPEIEESWMAPNGVIL